VDEPLLQDLAEHFPQLEILGMIGKGGMGAVYQARQRNLNRLVALKLLPLSEGQDPAFVERFSREAQALAKLNHPHIVAIYDVGQTKSYFYFLMEYVAGANLRQVLQAGKLSPEEALQIVPQVCDALQYAHSQGVVHRDIKPENILLDQTGQIKIADFGLAKFHADQTPGFTLTGTNQVMGTYHYMAPEQMEKPRSVDHRADIYSLGVVFYELLTGELPLGRFAPPSRKVQIDVRLDEVVLRALEKEPEHRYQKVSELKTEVEMMQKSVAAVEPKTAIEQPKTLWEQAKEHREKRAIEKAHKWYEFSVVWVIVACWCGILLFDAHWISTRIRKTNYTEIINNTAPFQSMSSADKVRWLDTLRSIDAASVRSHLPTIGFESGQFILFSLVACFVGQFILYYLKLDSFLPHWLRKLSGWSVVILLIIMASQLIIKQHVDKKFVYFLLPGSFAIWLVTSVLPFRFSDLLRILLIAATAGIILAIGLSMEDSLKTSDRYLDPTIVNLLRTTTPPADNPQQASIWRSELQAMVSTEMSNTSMLFFGVAGALMVLGLYELFLYLARYHDAGWPIEMPHLRVRTQWVYTGCSLLGVASLGMPWLLMILKSGDIYYNFQDSGGRSVMVGESQLQTVFHGGEWKNSFIRWEQWGYLQGNDLLCYGVALCFVIILACRWLFSVSDRYKLASALVPLVFSLISLVLIVMVMSTPQIPLLKGDVAFADMEHGFTKYIGMGSADFKKHFYQNLMYKFPGPGLIAACLATFGVLLLSLRDLRRWLTDQHKPDDQEGSMETVMAP
jgi:serine/threonine protein kinase